MYSLEIVQNPVSTIHLCHIFTCSFGENIMKSYKARLFLVDIRQAG